MRLKAVTAIFILLSVTASLFVAGCTSNTGSPSASPQNSVHADEMTTFSSDRGYSITHPKAWITGTSPNDPIELSLYPNGERNIDHIDVATQKLNTTTGKTLQNFVDYNLKNQSKYKNYKLLSTANTTLSGEPAKKIVWQATVPQNQIGLPKEESVKVMQVFTISSGTGFLITYQMTQNEYENYLPLVEQAIDSFTITAPTVTNTPTATPTSSTDQSSPAVVNRDPS